MSTIGDFLFGSSPKPQVSSSTSSTSTPEWYQQYLASLFSKAGEIANEPYAQNPNQRVAPLTAYQNQAYQSVADQQGAQQPLLDTARSFAQQAGSGFDANQLQTYMSPYTQNVVNTIGSLAGRNLSENILPQINDSFIRAGQARSAGNYDLVGRAIRDANESALNQQAQALESGYSTALGAYQNDQANRLSAAGTLGSLATTGQDIGLKGAAALEAAGQAQQQQGQKNLDVQNTDWLAQQNYPKEQASWLSQIFNGAQIPTSTTTSTTTTPSSQSQSPLSGLVGTIGGIGSLIGSLFAEGGPVQKKDEEDDKDPWIDFQWQDEDGNVFHGRERASVVKRANLDRRDAMTSPNHRKPVPGAIGYRRGGAIGSLARAA